MIIGRKVSTFLSSSSFFRASSICGRQHFYDGTKTASHTRCSCSRIMSPVLLSSNVRRGIFSAWALIWGWKSKGTLLSVRDWIAEGGVQSVHGHTGESGAPFRFSFPLFLGPFAKSPCSHTLPRQSSATFCNPSCPAQKAVSLKKRVRVTRRTDIAAVCFAVSRPESFALCPRRVLSIGQAHSHTTRYLLHKFGEALPCVARIPPVVPRRTPTFPGPFSTPGRPQ